MTTINTNYDQFMSEPILPLEHLGAQGRQRAVSSGTDHPRQEDLQELEKYALAIARDKYAENYDPAQHPLDKLREERYQDNLAELDDAKTALAFTSTTLSEREDELAQKQSDLRRPRLSKVIVSAAVITLSLSIGPTLKDRIFYTLEDEILAWLLSLICASFISILITWALVESLDATGKRTVQNVGGLIAGIGIGLGTGILRVSDAQKQNDFLFAVALTVIEVSTVLFLEWMASGLRREYSKWSANQEEINILKARLEAARADYTRREGRVAELEAKIHEHRKYVETRQVCHFKIKEFEDIAVMTTLNAYYDGVAANRGRKLGRKVD